MTILVDAHAFLWFADGDSRLSDPARRAIESPDSRTLLSMASVWEISIKASLGKLKLRLPIRQLVEVGALDNGIDLLPIRIEHACAVEKMPFHHRDPFDRLLAAQALLEGLILVSRDQAFDAYGVRRLW